MITSRCSGVAGRHGLGCSVCLGSQDRCGCREDRHQQHHPATMDIHGEFLSKAIRNGPDRKQEFRHRAALIRAELP
jgi:hypothetical protein